MDVCHDGLINAWVGTLIIGEVRNAIHRTPGRQLSVALLESEAPFRQVYTILDGVIS